ncbi:MAG TPA: zf-HC2 domain-containing protein [Symbiobacteriaceae bacterium]|nr:zf-HC2 domain-containing protein [Symbiobacteriaceae bacterium]
MTAPDKLDCKLTQDLLIGYVAGETSPETRDWVTRHLDRCDDCRQTLAEFSSAGPQLPPAPLPSDLPGLRLTRRIKLGVSVLLAIVLGSLALTGGAIWWALTQGRQLADLPADLAVPPAVMAPREAASQTPVPSGMTLQNATDLPDGVQYRFTNGARFELRQFADAKAAERAYNAWNRSFHVRTMSVSYDYPGGTAKFRSGGQYYYAWQREGWLVVIAVPDTVQDPAGVRDQIRDGLVSAFTALR